MPRPLLFTVAVAVVLGSPSRAFAQGGTSGSILGTVVDEAGVPVKGVKIAARSDTQIGGAKMAHTNDQGTFRIVGLQPGLFEISTSAPGLKSVLLKNIHVGINAPTDIDLVLEVEAAAQEVRIVEKAPVVSTSTANVKEIFDEEYLESIPLDNKTGFENIIANTVPGAVAGGQVATRIRGGQSNHTAFQVEGFHVSGQKSLMMRGQVAVEINTAGYGAEHASVPGGVVNMVTRSGSNRFEADVSGFTEDSRMRYFLQDKDTHQLMTSYVLTPGVSGPIIKDRLWFSTVIEARKDHAADILDPMGTASQNPARETSSFRGSGKVTWQVGPRNKLTSFSTFNLRFDANVRRGYQILVAPEAQGRSDDRDFFTGLIWEALPADNVTFRSQLGIQRLFTELGPEMCRSNPDCDKVESTFQTMPRPMAGGNFDTHTKTTSGRLQFINTLEWFPHRALLGEHDIKLKNDFLGDHGEVANRVPGDRTYQLGGAMPSLPMDMRTEFFANDPRYAPAAELGWFTRGSKAYRNVTSLSDAARVTRYLTITPGVALTIGGASNSQGESPYAAAAFTPHLAAAWDATHDSRTVVRGSFNNYVDLDTAALARHSLGSQVSRTCRWDPVTGMFSVGCMYSGGPTGSTFGLPCSPTGIGADGQPCTEPLRVPRTWELTMGAEREILPGIALGSDFVYRRYSHPFETRETNRIWSDTGGMLMLDGYRTGKSDIVQDMGTPDGAKRRYVGVTTSLHKREGAVRASVAYTWSRLEGNVLDGPYNAWGNIPPQDFYLYGYLPDDSRHVIRASVVYQMTRWVSGGLLYNYASGHPYSRRFLNMTTFGFDDYHAHVGVDPGANLTDPSDDRPLRLPSLSQLNLQGRVNLKPLTGWNLQGYVDVLNVMADRSATAVIQNDGPMFGQPISKVAPFRMRIGFRVIY